jgi:hypothetical protein
MASSFDMTVGQVVTSAQQLEALAGRLETAVRRFRT